MVALSPYALVNVVLVCSWWFSCYPYSQQVYGPNLWTEKQLSVSRAVETNQVCKALYNRGGRGGGYRHTLEVNIPGQSHSDTSWDIKPEKTC